jgi:hypothetical protein
MTDMGNNIWSIAVTYPAASVGATQTYKFVNNDWGTNEGTDPANTIASGGCGVDDGAGNINRTLVIPATNTEVCFVWDGCSACGAASVKGAVVNKLAIYPNPTSSSFRMDLTGNGSASASITDLTGKVVRTLAANSLGLYAAHLRLLSRAWDGAPHNVLCSRSFRMNGKSHLPAAERKASV